MVPSALQHSLKHTPINRPHTQPMTSTRLMASASPSPGWCPAAGPRPRWSGSGPRRPCQRVQRWSTAGVTAAAARKRRQHPRSVRQRAGWVNTSNVVLHYIYICGNGSACGQQSWLCSRSQRVSKPCSPSRKLMLKPRTGRSVQNMQTKTRRPCWCRWGLGQLSAVLPVVWREKTQVPSQPKQ